jgi:hypothetical protein
VTDGGTIGQTLGAQIGGICIAEEQMAFTFPSTQAHRQLLVSFAPAKFAAKTNNRNT